MKKKLIILLLMMVSKVDAQSVIENDFFDTSSNVYIDFDSLCSKKAFYRLHTFIKGKMNYTVDLIKKNEINPSEIQITLSNETKKIHWDTSYATCFNYSQPTILFEVNNDTILKKTTIINDSIVVVGLENCYGIEADIFKIENKIVKKYYFSITSGEGEFYYDKLNNFLYVYKFFPSNELEQITRFEILNINKKEEVRYFRRSKFPKELKNVKLDQIQLFKYYQSLFK